MPDINGIPYVESTDLVSGWPTVSQSVAQEVSDQLASKLDASSQKIVQVETATDSTNRTTTSTSFVDVTGMSVTITPANNTSAILIICTFYARAVDGAGNTARARYAITDSSNNTISSAQNCELEVAAAGVSNMLVNSPLTLIAYATPATTSATTYKLRFATASGDTAEVRGADTTSRIYAIEVSA